VRTQEATIVLLFGVIFVVAGLSCPACSQDLETQTKALDIIVKTANQICQSAPLEATNQGIILSGDAAAKLGGLVGRIANLGIAGAGQYQASQSMGVLQKDLIEAIKNSNECKSEVLKTLAKDLISGHNAPSTNNPGAAPPLAPPVREPPREPSTAALWPPTREPPAQPPVPIPPPAGPALHLGGQRWKIDVVNGRSVEIAFGDTLDHRGTLSGGHYGVEGKWEATGSLSVQIVTETYVMQLWFSGSGILKCGGTVQQRNTRQDYQITGCERRG
jgi:hypothetical protein